MMAVQPRLFHPWQILLVLAMGLLGLMGCADTASNERINSLTRADPNEQRNKAARRLALASAYFEQGQNDVAQQEVRAALLIDANYAEAYSLLGLIHQRDKAIDLAEQSFEQALKLALALPSRPKELAAVQHNYAWFLCEQNRLDQAQTQFARALSQPGYTEAAKTWMALGVCQLRAGKPLDARNSWVHALAHDPQNPVAQYQLAALDFQDGNPRRAQSYLGSLNDSRNATAQSLWLGIRLAHALVQNDELQRLSEQLLKKFPDSEQAHLLLQRNFDQP